MKAYKRTFTGAIAHWANDGENAVCPTGNLPPSPPLHDGRIPFRQDPWSFRSIGEHLGVSQIDNREDLAFDFPYDLHSIFEHLVQRKSFGHFCVL